MEIYSTLYFVQVTSFTWTHEIFQKIITTRFSDAGSSKKIIKMIYINFSLTWLNVFLWMVSA